ncbi:MAG: ParB/RepB/Spo0J family partition protein [Phycisphaerae bacterium]|jgi:ParB-like chromosome segregation protein Spo0J
MQTTIIRIPLDKLLPHPENPNKMSRQNFEKLKRHIKQSHNYEPLIIRKHPEIENHFQIINGHHRAQALRQIGETFADCVQWDIDDDQARILLATLNRLGGKDELAAKAALYKNLSEKFSVKDLSKLLPDNKQAIERLKDITKPPADFADSLNAFLNTLVFFLNDEQIETVETALEKAMPAEGTKSEKMANAITIISKSYIKGVINDERLQNN